MSRKGESRGKEMIAPASFINFTDIIQSYDMMQSFVRDFTGPDLHDAVYVASLLVAPEKMYVIDPNAMPKMLPVVFSERIRVIYHPLSDPPGTYSTKMQEVRK